MAKTKTPFLSLSSQGSIGQVLTSQKRGSATLLREKPLPAYRYTLPQAYQRWLYQDYAYLWRQEDAATRQEYTTLGSRCHLTGFQYYMRVNLGTLPDILGLWHLDEKSGAVAHDSSKQNHPGTIIGASPATGIIDGCQSFDGLNDRISIPKAPFLSQLSQYSLQVWFNSGSLVGDGFLWCESREGGPVFFLRTTGVQLQFGIYVAPAWKFATYAGPLVTDTWYMATAMLSAAGMELYLGDTLVAVHANTLPTSWITVDTSIGCYYWIGTWLSFLTALVDHVYITDRHLAVAEIERNLLRGYPP